MPKAKTHKGLSKRIKVTARGRVKFKRPGNSHLSSHKSGSKIRRFRQRAVLSHSFTGKAVEQIRAGS